MSMKFRSFMGVVVVLLASSITCLPDVVAQEEPSLENETIPELIDRVATQSSGDFFESRSLAEDAAFVFGIGYDEDKLAKDAQRIEVLYQDLLRQQVSSDPIIRTQDLTNPYTTSLQQTRQASP